MGQAQDDDDDDQLVGQINFGHRSETGTQFVKWCILHGYMVANTFSAETDQMWTYQNGKNWHQLDYIILSRSLAARFISCDVLSDVDIGSDHRPVQVKFSISSIKKNKLGREVGPRNSQQIRPSTTSPYSLQCAITIPPTWILKSKMFSWRK